MSVEQPKRLEPGHYEAVITFRRVGDEQTLHPETTLRLNMLLPVQRAGPVVEARIELWAALAEMLEYHVASWRAAKTMHEESSS